MLAMCKSFFKALYSFGMKSRACGNDSSRLSYGSPSLARTLLVPPKSKYNCFTRNKIFRNKYLFFHVNISSKFKSCLKSLNINPDVSKRTELIRNNQEASFIVFQNSQHQVEVRNITKKISDLNCKLDMVSTLSEPRENSYIEYVCSGLLFSWRYRVIIRQKSFLVTSTCNLNIKLINPS